MSGNRYRYHSYVLCSDNELVEVGIYDVNGNDNITLKYTDSYNLRKMKVLGSMPNSTESFYELLENFDDSFVRKIMFNSIDCNTYIALLFCAFDWTLCYVDGSVLPDIFSLDPQDNRISAEEDEYFCELIRDHLREDRYASFAKKVDEVKGNRYVVRYKDFDKMLLSLDILYDTNQN